MAISSMPIFSMLRTKMHWHQERQRLLSENVANADTPGYRPHDLAPPKFDDMPRVASLALTRTDAGHVAGRTAGSTQFRLDESTGYRVRPAGNAVSLEDEMMKVAGNQMDYQAATTLYSRSLGLVKTALGKR
ncbi:MAG: flagellar basal body rod protein FlgB [Pseudorhodoplanes sp.]